VTRSAEIDTVLLLSDPGLDADGGERLREALASEMDWYRVFGLLAAHRTAGIAWANVREYAIDTRQRMRAGYFLKGLEIMFRGQHHMAQEQLRYTRELMRGLEERGIRSALLKGAAVATMAYRDPGMRQFNDNDILVDRSMIPKVGVALNELGYTQGSWDYATGSVRPATRKEAVFLAVTSHQTYSYMRPTPDSGWLDAHRLDVHLSIDLMTANRTDDAIDALLAARVTVGDPPIWTIDPVDMLIFCCIHFYKEAIYIGEVRRLKDLVLYKLTDLLGLLRIAGDGLVDRARCLNQETAVYFALHHIDVLYPGRVEARLLETLRPSSLDYLDLIFDGLQPVHQWTRSIEDRFFDASRVADLGDAGVQRAASIP
jgi:hypothetical protein